MPNSAAVVCQPRPNGNTPRVAQATHHQFTLGGMPSIPPKRTSVAAGRIGLQKYVLIQQGIVGWVLVIWQAMPGNGCPIGTTQIIMRAAQPTIPPGRQRANIACCGAVLGSTLLAARARRTATSSILLIATTTSGSGLFWVVASPFFEPLFSRRSFSSKRHSKTAIGMSGARNSR